MANNVGLILLVFAFVFAVIATRWSSLPPWNLLAAAIAFWIASELVGGLGRVFH
jgi:uncharacterized membrane protein YagU involved in acid resistance